MDMVHLRPEARDLALLPATERLARMPANRWISYTRASQAIALLGRMLEREPGRIRPGNLLIVGATNNGKTAIAERFLRDHPQHPSGDGEHEVFPVLLVQMPPAPTVGRLYAAILAGLGVPGALHPRSPDREGAALYLLRRVECRMLVLDELHNLLAASSPRQRELFNLLRYLGNELRIPLACLGTREAYLAIRTDDQLENRFEPFFAAPLGGRPGVRSPARQLRGVVAATRTIRPGAAGDACDDIATLGRDDRRGGGIACRRDRSSTSGGPRADRHDCGGTGRVSTANRAPTPV